MWDYFEYVIPLMEQEYHLVIPALSGYDPETKEDFTSVEEIASELFGWCVEKDIKEIECLYGCSMGGSIVLRMLVGRGVNIRHAVIDGGITPYQLPWIITRFIALRDFLMISMGKIGGLELLQKAFSTDDYSEEDLKEGVMTGRKYGFNIRSQLLKLLVIFPAHLRLGRGSVHYSEKGKECDEIPYRKEYGTGNIDHSTVCQKGVLRALFAPVSG